MNIRKYKFCPFCSALYAENSYKFGRIKCQACSQVFYINSKPTASAIIIRDNKILLAVRGFDPGKGLHDIVGGFCDLGEHPEATLIREVKEETGMDVTAIKYLGVFMDEYGNDGESTMNFCYEVEAAGEPVPADDVAELGWYSLDELPTDFAFENCQAMIKFWQEQKVV